MTTMNSARCIYSPGSHIARDAGTPSGSFSENGASTDCIQYTENSCPFLCPSYGKKMAQSQERSESCGMWRKKLSSLGGILVLASLSRPVGTPAFLSQASHCSDIVSHTLKALFSLLQLASSADVFSPNAAAARAAGPLLQLLQPLASLLQFVFTFFFQMLAPVRWAASRAWQGAVQNALESAAWASRGSRIAVAALVKSSGAGLGAGVRAMRDSSQRHYSHSRLLHAILLLEGLALALVLVAVWMARRRLQEEEEPGRSFVLGSEGLEEKETQSEARHPKLLKLFGLSVKWSRRRRSDAVLLDEAWGGAEGGLESIQIPIVIGDIMML